MINCKEITEKASAYINKELSVNQRLWIFIHLLMCHHCRRFIRQFKITINTLSKLKKESPQDEVALASLARELREQLYT